MGTRPDNSFYERTPLWHRVTLSLIAAAVTPPLFLFIAFVNGWFVDSAPSSENLIFFVGLYAAVSAFAFLITVVMFEFWWRRHPPEWMVTDDDDGVDVADADNHD